MYLEGFVCVAVLVAEYNIETVTMIKQRKSATINQKTHNKHAIWVGLWHLLHNGYPLPVLSKLFEIFDVLRQVI